MSLIQEALKRQQQEYGSGTAPETPSSPLVEPPVTETMPVMAKPAPPDMPASTARTPATPSVPPAPLPPPLPTGRSSSKPWLRIGGLAVTVLGVLVVGGLLTAKLVFKAAQKKALLMQAVQPAAAIPGVDRTATQTEPVAARVEQAAARPLLPIPSPVAAAAPPLPAVAQTPAPAAKKEPPPVKKPKAPPASLQWPALKLTGILASPGAGEGAARINNQMVFVGGQINGVTLVEIRADGVMLKYGEEIRLLKIGGVVY